MDPVPGGTTKFYARRFAHETVIHRADATFAVGAQFTVDQEVAFDALDEWIELGSRGTGRVMLGRSRSLCDERRVGCPADGTVGEDR
jgi:hypothetical protein